MNFKVIVAFATENYGIGKDGKIPWRIPQDLRRFREITSRSMEGKENALIMGRKTAESIPCELPRRKKIIISTTMPQNGNVLVARNLEQALRMSANEDVNETFVIGGESVYREALRMEGCTEVYTTQVQGSYDCDTVFPLGEMIGAYQLVNQGEVQESGGIHYRFVDYKRITKFWIDNLWPTSSLR